jgi:hypothetical protein
LDAHKNKTRPKPGFELKLRDELALQSDQLQTSTRRKRQACA